MGCADRLQVWLVLPRIASLWREHPVAPPAANTSQVLSLVMGRGARLVAAGAFLGLIGAAALAKLEASLIYGLRVRDALTFVLAAFLIFFVALAASYIPARRASRLHPLDALRYE